MTRPKRKRRPLTNGQPVVREFFRLFDESPVTFDEMAQRSGIRRQTLSRWQMSDSPGVANLEACLNVLGYRLKIEPIPQEEKGRVG